VKHKKKLIEVALPLEAINVASAREKSIRHGHPSTLHLWWARRPLAAARAVIFAQMVDDPSAHPDIFKTEKAQEKERQRLFRIIEQLVLWENTTNEKVLQQARDEIWQSWRYTCAENADHPRAKELFDRNKLPAFHDPFAGGGSLPLEAQRLGLESYASDLNPVAVLICKAMIEIPPRFARRPPVNPKSNGDERLVAKDWTGARGLAEDVRYYGQWMRDEAEKRIGHLYPKVEVTAEMARDRPDLKPYVGRALTVIAWLWARTVRSPNPAFADVDVPLASTFMLTTKLGHEAYVEPVVDEVGYRFRVVVGKPTNPESAKNGTKLSRGANFKCLMSGTPIDSHHIYSEANAGRMGARLMAIVAESDRGRIYLAPTPEHERGARDAQPSWKPDLAMPENPRWFSPPLYGLKTYGDLFTPRQLVAMDTFSDLVSDARERVRVDARASGLPDDSRRLSEDGVGTAAYADALVTYLAIAVSRISSYWSNLTSHDTSREKITSVFARQAIPMVWDYMEGNPFSETSGNFLNSVEASRQTLAELLPRAGGRVSELDAAHQTESIDKVVSTDPPYYDNIGYADLSDFFYVWLRKSLRSTYPALFATLGAPKADELVATPYRHGGKEQAETFFLVGMTKAMHRVAEQAHPAFPVTIYYAFKQSEAEGVGGIYSTGWETFLEAVIRAGFGITGTWPIRTEMRGRALERSGTNALASSIILVCRKGDALAATISRGEFVNALKAEVPSALIQLQTGNIAPVDLQQAIIGPGMAVYTRYAKVLDAEGKPLPVRDALALINQIMDEALAQQEGDFDADSRWALVWFEQQGFAEGDYGLAEQLSKSKNTSVAGMVEAGFLKSGRGKVRLLRPSELPGDWDPATDPRLSSWEVVHHLVRALETGSEAAAAALVAKLGTKAETARQLAYRLFTIGERKKRAAEAMSYNALVQSWPEITRLAQGGGQNGPAQAEMFGEPGE
jgi:putative DNA methylase